MVSEDHDCMRDKQSDNHNSNNKSRKTGDYPQNINSRFKEREEFASPIHSTKRN
jgi:hypothetical protein